MSDHTERASMTATLPPPLTMSMALSPHYCAGWNNCRDEFTRAVVAQAQPADPLHEAVRSVCGQAGEAPEQFIEWLGKGGFAEMALCYFTRDKTPAVLAAPLTDAQWGNLLDSIDEIATQDGNGPLSEKVLDRIKRSIVFYGIEPRGISAPVVPTPKDADHV